MKPRPHAERPSQPRPLGPVRAGGGAVAESVTAESATTESAAPDSAATESTTASAAFLRAGRSGLPPGGRGRRGLVDAGSILRRSSLRGRSSVRGRPSGRGLLPVLRVWISPDDRRFVPSFSPGRAGRRGRSPPAGVRFLRSGPRSRACGSRVRSDERGSRGSERPASAAGLRGRGFRGSVAESRRWCSSPSSWPPSCWPRNSLSRARSPPAVRGAPDRPGSVGRRRRRGSGAVSGRGRGRPLAPSGGRSTSGRYLSTGPRANCTS